MKTKPKKFGSESNQREAMLATMVKMRPMTISSAMKIHIQRTKRLRMLAPYAAGSKAFTMSSSMTMSAFSRQASSFSV